MSLLWAADCYGKVFTISTADDHWIELDSNGLDIKKISVHEFFTWAIGGDHQIYMYVPARDIPIRYRVVTFENERWNPISGFCDKLLPTDRPHWSSEDGLVGLPQEKFVLPSNAWEWEEEWYVEDNLKGQPLEPEGWTYAIDFPAKYGPNKSWNSVVRRRKWIRYRRFCATNKWSSIPGVDTDPVKEPFIDVCVGGTEIPGGEPENFSVWAVTIQGRIMFRKGVSQTSPEGECWIHVSVPERCEGSQISVGPTGLVWAVTWTGETLIRTGVTRENAMGSSWIVIEPPNPEEGLTEVSVGKQVVWALSRSNKVWFRKGIDGYHSGENSSDATGSGWIEMFGNSINISVGLYDQVFSIDADTNNIQIRTSVNSSELYGRTWKSLEAPKKLLHHSSSVSSLDSISIVSQRGISTSTYTSDSISLDGRTQSFRKISTDSAVSCPVLNKTNEDMLPSNDISRSSEQLVRHGSGDMNDDIYERTVDDRSLSYCNLDSNSLAIDVPDIMWHSHMETVPDHSTRENGWTWISASGCAVDSEALPNWFCEGSLMQKSAVDEPWYNIVILELKDRYHREMEKFSTYPQAVEKSSWVKTVMGRWYKNHWVKCLLELLQHEDVASKSTLTWHYSKDMDSIQVKNITCIVCLPDWNTNILIIHTPKRTAKGSPYRFAFSSNDDLEDWLATLNTSCRNVNQISRVPEKKVIWSVTINGDVYVYNATHSIHTEPPVNMKWNLLGGGHLRLVETSPIGITWGLGYNCTAWVYTKGYGGGPFHGIPGSNASVGPMSDVRCLYIYENQRWNPLSGFTAKGLPTDRYMWSDKSGRVECTKENTHLPSCHWQWISDWCIDYKTPGGADNEGWQYATDFPRKYHGYKRFTDYVRRRRWYRKCKLTTSGPWTKLGNTPLLDVSFQIDSFQENEQVAVWAVAINGDVLYRTGVTEHSPKGISWIHIPTEKPFCSISVGCDGVVWAVADDGSAQLRQGISSKTPTGQYWCHVEPPQVGCPIRQISVGKTKVLAVDDNNRLWARQEIVEIFKEGTHWKLISDNVKQVSVGPTDQIWCIKNNFTTPSGVISGVVCRRANISDENPYGTEWEQGIGGCWNYITIRGINTDEE